MKAKREFLRCRTFIIRDGSQTRFWEDKWLGNATLREQHPCLYNIVRQKQDNVAEVLSSSPPNLSWHRNLIWQKLAAWNELIPCMANIILCHEWEEFQWNLHPNGKFSVKSQYLAMIHADVPNINKDLWKLKTPLKIKIFMWYLRQGVILTKDNLAKWNWQGRKQWCFCHKDETIKHQFFYCRFTRAVWSIIHAASGLSQPCSMSHMFGTWLRGFRKDMKSLFLLGVTATCRSLWLCRNGIIFYNKLNSCPLQVIFSIILWLRTWAVLQKTTPKFRMEHSRRTLLAKVLVLESKISILWGGWSCWIRC
jgi:hypothetical protein